MYLPWWLLLAGLAASAFAAYLLLGLTRAGDSPWVRLPLTAVMAPVIFLGSAVAGITLSVLLSMLLEDRIPAPTGSPEPPAQTERTDTEATPEGTGAQTTLEHTGPATRTPSASPSVSPSASPSASPTASSSASPSP